MATASRCRKRRVACSHRVCAARGFALRAPSSLNLSKRTRVALLSAAQLTGAVGGGFRAARRTHALAAAPRAAAVRDAEGWAVVRWTA